MTLKEKNRSTTDEQQTRKEMPEIIVPRQNAVFWMDGKGAWHNEGGRFELRKIIRRFNASIEKDVDGYYITQINGNRREKVYFPYEDTALFAIDIQKKEPMTMRLNTGQRLLLNPASIYNSEENLYTCHEGEWIKFSERSLLKLSSIVDYETNPFTLHYCGCTYSILPRPLHSP